jgi:Trk K+ transport system NAD-binding subunit
MTHGTPGPILIVGAGRVGHALLHGLPAGSPVTLIDLDPGALAAPLARTPAVRTIAGDGTSRLTLVDAGVGNRTRVIAATGSDRANEEVLRVARELGAAELVGVFHDAPPDLGSAEVIHRATACAGQLLSRVTTGSNRGVTLGLGQGELVQVTVLPGSQAVGRPLREVGASHWLVAALYRADTLIVPHGHTVVEAGDRVLLVGAPEVLEEIAAFFRGGAPVFPYQYGPDVLHAADPGAHALAAWLTRIAEARACRPGEVPDRDAGCLVLAPPAIPWTARAGFAASAAHDQIARSPCPVLIARRPPPIERILLALDRLQPEVALVAFDLARQAQATLRTLTVSPPSLVRGADPPLALDPQPLERLARLHSVTLEHVIDHGNPVTCVRRHAAQHDLVVVGVHARRPSPFDPDISVHLLHELPTSILFVPRREV